MSARDSKAVYHILLHSVLTTTQNKGGGEADSDFVQTTRSIYLEDLILSTDLLLSRLLGKMKKGLHPQMQWISYVTQSGRLMQVMMTKIHPVGKVYHLKAKRQMAENIGQVAKFKQRYEKQIAPKDEP
ncbi:hypothetical protein D8674_022185 [Pyrus ussuriensis x Pyrus communis]|uniref:Uncharacterized protein n=2 Tax=Maleae TaxID=721813 RepID=A0A5N5GKF4_9ROSA|nr:hypothetical protein D8674_022185 [Pyrus ussuriensis x Pyrus communis]